MNKAALARTSGAAYAQRMNKVLDHIDHHLDAPLDLSTLAAVAHFSSFQFHGAKPSSPGEWRTASMLRPATA